jgi:hypothetical protein
MDIRWQISEVKNSEETVQLADPKLISDAGFPAPTPKMRVEIGCPCGTNVDGRRGAVRKKWKDTDRYNLIQRKQESKATGNPEPSSKREPKEW